MFNKNSLGIIRVYFVFVKNMTRLHADLTFVIVRNREYEKKIMFFYDNRLSPAHIFC